MGKTSQPAALDAFDHKILAILQKDNLTPQRTIGEAVNLSAPAVQRRIKRMTEAGVIRANVAIVDPVAIGQAITIFVEVEVISETAAQIESAKREFATAPEIQQCYYVTGEADFMLVIIVPTMADYEALTRRLFFGNNNVKRFRTLWRWIRSRPGWKYRCRVTPDFGTRSTNRMPRHRCRNLVEIAARFHLWNAVRSAPASQVLLRSRISMPRRSRIEVKSWYEQPEAEVCPLCDREIPPGQLDAHHLIPKSRGGRKTESLHRICHRQIHALFTEAELAKQYFTVEAILEHPEMQKFVIWVKKKPPDFIDGARRTKRIR